jgi:Ion channel
MYNLPCNQIWVIKCQMIKNPIRFVSMSFLIGAINFGYALRVAEAPLSRKDSFMDHSNFISCIWEAIITMTTVGYGDYYPRTLTGRIIILFCSIYGVTIVSLIVVTLTNLLEMSSEESKAYLLLEKLRNREII